MYVTVCYTVHTCICKIANAKGSNNTTKEDRFFRGFAWYGLHGMDGWMHGLFVCLLFGVCLDRLICRYVRYVCMGGLPAHTHVRYVRPTPTHRIVKSIMRVFTYLLTNTHMWLVVCVCVCVLALTTLHLIWRKMRREYHVLMDDACMHACNAARSREPVLWWGWGACFYQTCMGWVGLGGFVF
ncbi:hypothetical protein DM02DRAFT_386838 [Periconia macrospinosa]|uniref:Uncharacterized protein n=1 Tax=Periconia macrospinosa TaxID=97972 RepID=A0A2V1CZ08_9PLEO|nr:hypothetical protein DM02DRAFT_386838 [Periconia macrospinosa]